MTFAAHHSKPIISLLAAVVLALVGAGASPLAASAAPADPGLNQKLGALMKDPVIKQANSALIVMDARNGTELYYRRAWSPHTPASNTKIFTAAAALQNLGPNYRFRTEVIVRATPKAGVIKGNLYLKGYGDPTSMMSDYRSLAKQVAARGIKRVTGHLVTDASYFDAVRYNPNWNKSYASDYYAAQISALTVAPNADYDAGTIIVNYRPGAKGAHAAVTVTPGAAVKYVKIVNRTTTSDKGTGDTFAATRAAGSNTIVLTGKVAKGRSVTKHWVTVNQPQLYAGAVFRSELAKAGVKITGATLSRATPAGKRYRVGIDRSAKLSALLVPFLKLSNNMIAEHLTKTMGAGNTHPGTWARGLTRTRSYVRSTGAPMTGLRLVDGSGLTRENKITPRSLGIVLYRLQQAPWYPSFRRALPVAANPDRMTGGTLSSRMRGTRAANNARAKTGSLTGVTTLSGYVTGADGRRYIFSMLSEYQRFSPRSIEDKMVITLANHRR